MTILILYLDWGALGSPISHGSLLLVGPGSKQLLQLQRWRHLADEGGGEFYQIFPKCIPDWRLADIFQFLVICLYRGQMLVCWLLSSHDTADQKYFRCDPAL